MIDGVFNRIKQALKSDPKDEDILLRLGDTFEIGGVESEAIKVTIREPVMNKYYEIVEMVAESLFNTVNEERMWKRIDELQALRKAGKLKWRDVGFNDLLRMKPVLRGLEAAIGKIVGQSGDYVRYEMTATQVEIAIMVWVNKVGFSRIRDLFFVFKKRMTEATVEDLISSTTFDPQDAQ